MPVQATTAYGNVEQILLDARALANDMEVPGGDVLTDAAPKTLRLVNIAYRRVQSYLAQYGVETYATYAWLLNIPANTTGDPESRVLISDSGTDIETPSGAGESSFANPFLPDDLVAPLRMWERPNGSTLFSTPMTRHNDGIQGFVRQGTYLCNWEWIDDTLQFRGATANQDVRLKYEKHLPVLSTVGDAVPIRGVDNAVAYRVVYDFSKGLGGAMADSFGSQGQVELDLLVNRSVRERQRIKHRRQPYRGMRGQGRGRH